MPVEKDPSGRRFVQAEVEVPGTPEAVWASIATGPGISSWMVPSEVDGREGGKVISHFGPDGTMDSHSTITTWDPPKLYVCDSRDDMGPGDPTIATEWHVEAHAGGTCTVRVVHRWFSNTDDWDAQFEGHTYGWLAFFRVLRLYLAHFSGQPGVSFQVMGVAPQPKATAWAALTGPLGLAGVVMGQHTATPPGLPPLAGTVEWPGQPAYPEELLIRLDSPAPGIVHIVAHEMGGQVYQSVRFSFYGDEAVTTLATTEAAWQAWMLATFPMPAAPVEC